MQAPGPEAAAAPTAPAAEPPLLRRCWRRLARIRKTAYIVCATAFSVWVVSFGPAEGPPIQGYLPATSALTWHVRSGTDFLQIVCGNRVLQELLNDPDVAAVCHEPLEQLDEARERYSRAPAIVRWFAQPTPAGLRPFIGQEWAVAELSDAPATDNALNQDGAGVQPKARGAPLLFFTRLSGSRGHLLRMGAAFAKLPRQVRFFDLGGGLVAVGFNGAAPAAHPHSPPYQGGDTGGVQPRAMPGAAPDGVFLGRLGVSPLNLLRSRGKDLSGTPQYEQLRKEGVPAPVLRALAQPPSVLAKLGLDRPPATISLELFATPDGGLAARGRFDGALPPLQAVPMSTGDQAYAEGLLPVDLRECFLGYLESEMRVHKDSPTTTRRQRRWSQRFAELEGAGVDLDLDLWPAAGHVLHVTIQSDSLDPEGYGLIRAELPFDASNAEARGAAVELARQRWDGYLFEGPVPSNVKPPYIKRLLGDPGDLYLLNTGQITVPAWLISKQALLFTSNVGPYALRDPSALWRMLRAEPDTAPPKAWFLHVDGPRLAPTVERLATLHFDNLEEEIGSREFLAQYPDAAIRVRLAAKISCLLGMVKLDVTPEPGGNGAAIGLLWTPGMLKTQPEESVPPPPPPPPPRRAE